MHLTCIFSLSQWHYIFWHPLILLSLCYWHYFAPLLNLHKIRCQSFSHSSIHVCICCLLTIIYLCMSCKFFHTVQRRYWTSVYILCWHNEIWCWNNWDREMNWYKTLDETIKLSWSLKNRTLIGSAWCFHLITNYVIAYESTLYEDITVWI